MDLVFSDRNLKKNGLVESKEDASLTVFLLNACSLLNKFDEVITLSVSHKPHIIAITKSWLHDKISDPEIEIRDYRLFRKDRKGRGSGALLFIRWSLRPKQIIQLKLDGTPFTDVFVLRPSIATSNATPNILCVYRSPRST